MSFDGSIALVWGGDERRFRLGLAELIALQEKRSSGPLEIAARLQLGTWRVEDIVETLRIALIGGGDGKSENAKTARELIAAHVRPGKFTENALTAFVVLTNALQGDAGDDEEVGQSRTKAEARLSVRKLYAAGAVMGFTPEEIGKMSLYQYAAVVDGWNEANSDSVEPPSAEEFDAAKRQHGDA